jgi:hypothetical protein
VARTVNGIDGNTSPISLAGGRAEDTGYAETSPLDMG